MYTPNPFIGDVSAYLQSELQKISEAMNNPQPALKLSVSYSPPTKFGEGTIVLADGTSFNPGSGAGFYGYRGGSWRKLD